VYVTPERFRTMGLGVDLTNVEEVEIRSALTRASAVVDSYCAVPLLPQKFDFRGGTITEEEHEWVSDPYEVSVRPFRFWPWHKPVRAVTAFRIYSTPAIYTEVENDEVFINRSGGYIEVRSLKLTQYGIFGAGVITALVGMWNPVARVSYTYGYQFPVTAEILEPTDALLYRAQHQWWDSAEDVEVFVNGTVVDPADYTVDYDEGTILFDSAQAADSIVTASYTHRLPWQIGHAAAIIAADDLGERGLRAKGMTGVDTLAVGEITIRRSAPNGQRGGTLVAESLPAKATSLLNGFTFSSVR
jgi:hypothetical protein